MLAIPNMPTPKVFGIAPRDTDDEVMQAAQPHYQELEREYKENVVSIIGDTFAAL